MKIFLLMVVMPLAFSPLRADATSERQDLIATVQNKDIPVLVALIKGGSVNWPKLMSDQSKDALTAIGPKNSELGLALLNHLRDYEKQMPRDKDTSMYVSGVYGALSQELDVSGGFMNMVLSDSVNRLAVARLAEVVINHPEAIDRASQLMMGLPNVHSSMDRFVKMMHEEQTVSINPSVDLASLDDKIAQNRILAAVGQNRDDVLLKFGTNQANTSSLIKERDVAVLLRRMGQTDVEANVNLSGLISFYKCGGNPNQLKGDDVRPFDAVMKGAQFNFKSDLMGVNRVWPDFLLQFIKIFKNNNGNSFLNIAIN